LASLFPEQYRVLIAGIIQARKNAGITQAVLAKVLGQSQSFVSKYESGERRLDPVEFMRISQILKSDPLEALSASIEGSVSTRSKRRRCGKM